MQTGLLKGDRKVVEEVLTCTRSHTTPEGFLWCCSIAAKKEPDDPPMSQNPAVF